MVLSGELDAVALWLVDELGVSALLWLEGELVDELVLLDVVVLSLVDELVSPWLVAELGVPWLVAELGVPWLVDELGVVGVLVLPWLVGFHRSLEHFLASHTR